MSTDKMALPKAVRYYCMIHEHTLNDLQVDGVCKLIGAILDADKEMILEILEPWSDELKDECLSISWKYLLEQNIPISYNISEFVGISLLPLRFYSPGVGKQLQLSKAKKTNILEYMMKHMDAILIWKGPTDKRLLYHIKQVVLMANEVRYLFRSGTKMLPWIKLIFYCVQYIKYFYATGNRNTLASLMSNDKLINYIKLWKIGLENMHDKEKWQDKKIQDMLQDFEDTYDSIRDIYTIDKMKKFSTIRTSFLNNLRILQVFGECVKSTIYTPNISLRLQEHFKSHLGTDYKNLIELRNTISHLTGIPECTQYVIKQVAKLTHTMESTLRKISDSIFNEFDSDYDSDSDNYIYDSQKDLIKTINQEINDAPKLSYYDCLKQLEDALNHNKEQGEIEMLLMIILNNLNEEQGRLNANREWFMEKYPTLTGQQLRNHLAHGDPIVELMDVDIKMAARHTAIMLIKELKMNDKNNKKIEKVTKRPAIEVMREIDYQQITHLEKEKKLFQIIIEGDLEKFKDYLQNISSEWVNWQDLRKRNALHYAAANKKDNLELFQFVLEESSSYMKQIKADSSLLFQASNNFKIAKRIVELHICALLENDRTYLQQNDNNDILELCKKLMKTEKIHSFWNVCYYQISCDNIENLKLLLDSIYYLSLKDLDYTVSGTGTMNFRMYRIASFYHAKEVMNYLINIGYAINYPNINHQEIHTYSNTEKYNELREIIKSGQVFKVKEHKEIDVMNSLHFAVQSRNSEIVKQVYQCLPVLLFKKNNEDKTPLDVAVNENRVKEFNVLIEQAINNSSKQLQMFKTLANEIINLRESNIFRDNKGVAENVLSNSIYAMKMNPEEKTVQYWAIKLAQSMLGYYKSKEHLINSWEQIAINTLFHFSDESPIVEECIDFVVEIFDHKWRAQPKYNIADQLETILCAKYDHSSIILEKLNIALQNKIEYGHWSKKIAHHAKYAIETFTDDPHIQRYAIKLIYHLHKSGTDSGVYDLRLRTSLKKVLSVFKNDSTVHICCYLIGFYLICYESTKLEETDNKIKSEMNYFNLEDEWEIYFKNLVIRHFEVLEYDWLTYAVKTQFMPYNPKITNEEVHAISELIHAIQDDKENEILEIIDLFNEDSKDELLSMSVKYLNDQHFAIPKEVAKFINTTLLTMRFYTNDTSIQEKPDLHKKEEEEEEEEMERLEYLIKQMDIISKWTGSNNELLLYHIKQVIFHADSVRYGYENLLPKLPWLQLIFYLQQYIKYFTSRDEIHLYQIGLISQKELTKVINLFRTVLLSVKNKKTVKLTSEDETIIEDFKEIYHEIRDVYVLYRICHYIDKSNQKNKGLIILRIIQVIGESLKQTDNTPNVSGCLLNYIKEYFCKEDVTGIINLRNIISHLTRIPNCVEAIPTLFEEALNDISKTFIHIRSNYICKKYNDRIDKFINNSRDIGELPNFYNVTNKNVIKNILSRNPDREKSKIEYSNNIKLLTLEIKKDQDKQENTTEYQNCLEQLHKSLNETNNYMEIELILMITLNNLNKIQKRLNTNRKWFQEKYPTLTGEKLRHHLAHGDPIVELLGIDEEMAVRDTAKLLTDEQGNPSTLVIEKITKVLEVDQLKEIDKIQLRKTEQIENLFEYINEGKFEQVLTLLGIVKDKWVYWRDKNGHSVIEAAARNKEDNVKLFKFILNQNPKFINQINKNGNSILQIANMAGNTYIAKCILKQKNEAVQLPRISESTTNLNELVTELYNMIL